MATVKNNLYQSEQFTPKGYGNSVYSSPSNENNLASMNYVFKERTGKLKWKEIMKLDLDLMIRNGDLSLLENYLENIIFASIDENDMQIVPEISFLKLVKMYQYITEYLLYTQQRLENDNKILDANYTQLINESISKEAQLKENKSLISTLKRDKKEKEMVLNTYKCLIDEYKLGNINQGNSKRYFLCTICDGKKFSTEENLNAHYERRHVKTNQMKNIGEEPSMKYEEKVDQMKTYFETYVKSFQNESYQKIQENQKNLENKLIEVEHGKKNDLKEIENQLKSTLIEIKDLYLKTSLNLNQSNIGNSYVAPKDENIAQNIAEMTKKKLKKTTNKINSLLNEVNNEQNNKMMELMQQMTNLKNSISQEVTNLKNEKNEISEIKSKFSQKQSDKLVEEKAIDQLIPQKTKKNKKKSKISEKQLDTFVEEKVIEQLIPQNNKENKLNFKPVISHIESLEIKKDINLNSLNKNQFLIRDSNLQNSITKTKKHFNAGPLESDDDCEIELKDKSNSNFKNELTSKEELLSFNKNNDSCVKNSICIAPDKEFDNVIIVKPSLESNKKSIIDNLEKDINSLDNTIQISRARESKINQTKEENNDMKETGKIVIDNPNIIEETPPMNSSHNKREELLGNVEKFYNFFTDRDVNAFNNIKADSLAVSLM